jgi:hypothetical protein
MLTIIFMVKMKVVSGSGAALSPKRIEPTNLTTYRPVTRAGGRLLIGSRRGSGDSIG